MEEGSWWTSRGSREEYNDNTKTMLQHSQFRASNMTVFILSSQGDQNQDMIGPELSISVRALVNPA